MPRRINNTKTIEWLVRFGAVTFVTSRMKLGVPTAQATIYCTVPTVRSNPLRTVYRSVMYTFNLSDAVTLGGAYDGG